MIDINEIFSDSDKKVALWCDDVVDTADLASVAENIVQSGIDLISVSPNMVQNMWVYLEKKPIKILTHYDFLSNNKNIDEDISDLGKKIKDICKHGADGVQIFIEMKNFEIFVEKILPVKNDLFFEKNFGVYMDIIDIDINNLEKIFQKLNEIGANVFGLTLKEDMGNRSDFVGRVYAILNNWNFNGELHFLLNNDYERMDQVIRLIESEKPELKVKFFLEY